VMEVLKCKDNKEVKQVGVEWCIAQCRELKAKGVPVLHFYSMGKSENIKTIVNEVL